MDVTFEEQSKALNAFLNETYGKGDYDIQSHGDAGFETSVGFFRVSTPYESEPAIFSNILDHIEDNGIASFDFDYLGDIYNYIDSKYFFDVQKEYYLSYCEEIASEQSSDFESRLVEECYQNGIITEIDFDSDGNCLVSDSDLIDMYTEYLCDNDIDAVQWFIDTYGESSFYRVFLKDPKLVKSRKLATDILSLDPLTISKVCKFSSFGFSYFEYSGKIYVILSLYRSSPNVSVFY